MSKIGPLEIFLIEFVIFLGIWVFDSYLATLLTSIFVPILIFILIIAWISERLEPSRVPKSYFRLMGVSILAMLSAAGAMWGVGLL